MNVQRTLTVILLDDADVRATLHAVNAVKQALSPVCFNDGTPLGALPLHQAAYEAVKGTVSSQLTISAIRVVAAAYASAKRNKKPAKRPFRFGRPSALFLIGERGRDADFRSDGTVSIWTVAGRKRITYTVPDYFKAMFAAAVEFDSLTLIERTGVLLGRVTVTLAMPDPKGVHPVGVDRGETNILVAVDADDNETFVSGLAYKVANRRQHKVRSRLQRKYASRKADSKDTRSIRRLVPTAWTPTAQPHENVRADRREAARDPRCARQRDRVGRRAHAASIHTHALEKRHPATHEPLGAQSAGNVHHQQSRAIRQRGCVRQSRLHLANV